ncbi:MAG: hypothetical protein R2856_32485 [Caldilineaceae bacterium]
MGRQLLRRAGEIAIERGYLRAMLYLQFPEPAASTKRGYRIVGALNYPPGGTFYWLRKDFGMTG